HYCLSYFTTRLPPISTLFPYTTLFRSGSQTADASVDPSIRFESSYTSNSYCEAFGIVNYSMQPVSITGNVLGGLNIQPGGSNSSGYWRAFSAIADYPSSNSSTTATTISGNTVGGPVAHSLYNPSSSIYSVARGIGLGNWYNGYYKPTEVTGNTVRNI